MPVYMKWLCSNIYAKHNGCNCNRLIDYSSFTFQNVLFFSAVGLPHKTADIERIMCATVVTFQKKHTVGGSKISFGRYARAGDRNKFA